MYAPWPALPGRSKMRVAGQSADLSARCCRAPLRVMTGPLYRGVGGPECRQPGRSPRPDGRTPPGSPHRVGLAPPGCRAFLGAKVLSRVQIGPSRARKCAEKPKHHRENAGGTGQPAGGPGPRSPSGCPGWPRSCRPCLVPASTWYGAADTAPASGVLDGAATAPVAPKSSSTGSSEAGGRPGCEQADRRRAPILPTRARVAMGSPAQTRRG